MFWHSKEVETGHTGELTGRNHDSEEGGEKIRRRQGKV